MSGTPRPRISAGQPEPGSIDPGTLAEARESFLYVDPVWLAATDHALTGMRPFHTVARRREDEHAVLPAYLVESPALPDVDPLTYLQSGPVAPGQCGTGGCGPVAGVSSCDLLPSVVLGSPLGFHTEPFFTFWNERLLADMVTATVDAARSAGARSIVAPWISHRLTGADLAAALRGAGAAETFWGNDEHIPLTAASSSAHLQALPKKQRQRLTGDVRRIQDSATMRTLRGADIHQVLDELAELIAGTYQRHGTPLDADAIRTAATALATSADTYAICAHDPDTDQLLGGHILFYRHPRLYAKWLGTTDEAAGTGLYFALGVEAAIELGYQLGATSLELGAGAYEAKRLRGSLSRTKTTALLAFDPDVHVACQPLLAAFGQARRAAQDPDGPATAPGELTLTSTSTPSTGGCCSG